MDALEIEEAISKLATQSFDACEFPFAFLKAFGNKETTIKKLRSIKHTFNSSDISGGVLQRDKIHIAASSGDKDATKNRDIVAKEMSPSQIEKAQDMAREWIAKH